MHESSLFISKPNISTSDLETKTQTPSGDDSQQVSIAGDGRWCWLSRDPESAWTRIKWRRLDPSLSSRGNKIWSLVRELHQNLKIKWNRKLDKKNMKSSVELSRKDVIMRRLANWPWAPRNQARIWTPSEIQSIIASKSSKERNNEWSLLLIEKCLVEI